MYNYALIGIILLIAATSLKSQNDTFAMENLVAWCVVPYDALERNASERASMLKELGFTKFAWDWRMKHIPLLEEEIEVMRAHDIEISAVWFWIDNRAKDSFQDHQKQILATIKKTELKTTLWVGFDNDFFENLNDDEKVEKGAAIIQRLLNEVKSLGVKLALYNHGDWFGEPENQIKILNVLGVDSSGTPEIGLVYNFHHGHHQVDDFKRLLALMLPYLTTVNLNGMIVDGPKILGIGEGDREAEMLKILQESGFQGTIGILDHVEEVDSKLVLRANLEGLRTIVSLF
jgi:hypothetical protein